MKKTLLFYNFLALIACLQAQPQLSLLNTPQSGSTYFFHPGSASTVSPGNVGSNVIWDFSELSISADTIAVFYTSDTSYNAFPDYDYPSFYFDTSKYNLKSYHYLYKITDERFSIAYQIVPVTQYTPQACPVDITLFNMPFSYEDEVSETWSCGAVNAGIRDIQADGYGTLILPDSTYINALRLHTTEKQEFEPSSPNPSAHYDTIWTDHYQWFSETSQVPLLAIHFYTKHSWSMGDLASNEQTTIRAFFSSQLPTSVKPDPGKGIGLSVYPNPARDKIRIEWQHSGNNPATFDLIDLQGQVIARHRRSERHQGESSFEFSVEGIPTGLYFLRMSSPDRTAMQKVIVAP